MIPESNYLIPFRFDQPRTSRITFLAVLTAVDFDHEARSMTREIGGEHSEWGLKSESRIGKAFA
jgi:hypothetical protein